jgi:hypothetical protein
VCVFLCVSTPTWLHLPDISIFAISTHSILAHLYPLQHALLLMLSLSLFATCHPKKGLPLAECLLPLQNCPPLGQVRHPTRPGALAPKK